LIPVYNWDVRPLLEKLSAQCAMLGGDGERVEIIVIDDGSRERFDTAVAAEQFSLVIYEEFPVNRGRVAARNTLLDKAKGEYVLFLDADMLPDHGDFIQIYRNLANSGHEIVCGGISYLQIKEDVDTDHDFYLYKSKKTEALPAKTRNRTPWRYLFTSNIMLRRDIVDSIRFDSRFTGYGYEDIEWAIRLCEMHTIKHINNTCSHMGVMNKEQVYRNMCDSIENYALLLTLHPEQTAGGGAVRIAGKLTFVSVSLLNCLDTVLSKIFSSITWNPLLFLVFQCDKVVLLARALKAKAEV
ncbi:glycosyltransferase family 2 protein, partial [Desulfotalea psychrophila]|nr:glycosyltransferase family 2 protein [Desulfotalea psychrophila]